MDGGRFADWIMPEQEDKSGARSIPDIKLRAIKHPLVKRLAVTHLVTAVSADSQAPARSG